MAITPVQVPNTPAPQRPEREESWLDVLLKGLQIVNAGAGIYENVQKIGMNSLAKETAERQAAGITTPQEVEAAHQVAKPAVAEQEVMQPVPGAGTTADPNSPLLGPFAQQSSGKSELLPTPQPLVPFQTKKYLENGKLTPSYIYEAAAPEKRVEDISKIRSEVDKKSEDVQNSETYYNNVQKLADKARAGNKEAQLDLMTAAARLRAPTLSRNANGEPVPDTMTEYLTKKIAQITGKGGTGLNAQEVNEIVDASKTLYQNQVDALNKNLGGEKEAIRQLGANEFEANIRDRSIPSSAPAKPQAATVQPQAATGPTTPAAKSAISELENIMKNRGIKPKNGR